MDVVIEELVEAKRKFDITSVMFYDDVFTMHPQWLREFAPRYKAEVGLPFWCYTYPDDTRKEDMRAAEGRRLHVDDDGHPVGQRGDARRCSTGRWPGQGPSRRRRSSWSAGIEGFFDLITRVQFEKERHLRETFEFLVDFPTG